MVDKVTLTNVSTFVNDNSAVSLINNNSAAITTALNNTLSRDGTSPNTMGTSLDMNSNKVINLPAASSGGDAVRYTEFAALQTQANNTQAQFNNFALGNVQLTVPAHTLLASTGGGVKGLTLTSGQILLGSTGADPVPTTLATSATVDTTNASNITSGTLSLARISGLATSATTDTTNASNITSGTLAVGILPAGTGTGSLVYSNSPSLSTPSLDTATATSINKVAITAPATGSTLTIANGKTLTVSNTITLAGTDSTVMTFPSTSKTIAANDLSNVTLSGDATNSSAAVTVTKINGKTVTLGANLTTTGAGAPTLAFSGTSRTYTFPDAAVTLLSTGGAVTNQNPSNPTGTTSASGVMMGMGSTCTITPLYSSRVYFRFSGTMSNSASGDGAELQGKWGTGSAPANAAALSGTSAGSLVAGSVAANGQFLPYSTGALITGLTPGTAYWFDLSLLALTGGTASILNNSFTAFEI